ncbi:Hypothetical predicted protein [Mytilus galloprovincialis]|uniref:Cystatin domain-containing protein n=1 Tax=Mytilus galloprovincialis TaxID=29158 RepID=A0A8B6EKP6_MYTGA|nr:Hypothetical predicted protein [Mytilus galloprovincialis]
MQVIIVLALVGSIYGFNVGSILPGGLGHVDSNDAGLMAAVQDASKSVNMMSNNMMHLTTFQVTHATKQVIRGLRYTFDVSFKEASSCKNTKEHYHATLTECPPADGAQTMHFHCSVVDVAWETPRYTTTCTMK